MAQNVVVTRKPQINFYVPDAVRNAWDTFSDPYGLRRGSSVGMAALLMFLSASKAEQEKWIAKVGTAESLGKLDDLFASFPKSDVAGAIKPTGHARMKRAGAHKDTVKDLEKK